jgi:hypothetical protein
MCKLCLPLEMKNLKRITLLHWMWVAVDLSKASLQKRISKEQTGI